MDKDQDGVKAKAATGIPISFTACAIAGAASALIGFAGGSIAGVLLSKRPLRYGVLTGMHWGSMGTTFWLLRSAYLTATTEGLPTESDRLYGSTIAGSITGSFVASTYGGPRQIPKGAINFALVGFLGQWAFNYLDQQHTASLESTARPPLLERMSLMKWSPIAALPNKQYIEMLQEQVTAVEAEISILDEGIEKLKAEHLKTQTAQLQNNGPSSDPQQS